MQFKKVKKKSQFKFRLRASKPVAEDPKGNIPGCPEYVLLDSLDDDTVYGILTYGKTEFGSNTKPATGREIKAHANQARDFGVLLFPKNGWAHTKWPDRHWAVKMPDGWYMCICHWTGEYIPADPATVDEEPKEEGPKYDRCVWCGAKHECHHKTGAIWRKAKGARRLGKLFYRLEKPKQKRRLNFRSKPKPKRQFNVKLRFKKKQKK